MEWYNTKEQKEKRKNLAIALCTFGEYVKWFTDNIGEIPVVGSMECPITDRFKYDDEGHVIRYPNSDSIIGFDVLECCRLMDKIEAEYLNEDERSNWEDYVGEAYSALWKDIDFDDI